MTVSCVGVHALHAVAGRCWDEDGLMYGAFLRVRLECLAWFLFMVREDEALGGREDRKMSVSVRLRMGEMNGTE